MTGNTKASELLMYIFLFICIFTSNNWEYDFISTEGEILRFDKIMLFGQANIYHLFTGLFFLIVLFVKFNLNDYKSIWNEKSYLKNIFWIYLIPVNILVYLTVHIKDIPLHDMGVGPIIRFFVYLVLTFYIHDVFLKNKNRKKLSDVLTVLEVMILCRCCYSIVKYFLGYGIRMPVRGLAGIRLGQENDFADFFILLFIIALTRLLYEKNKNKITRILHCSGLITSAFVAIFSFRRYFLGELLVAFGIISIFYLRQVNLDKKIITVCAVAFLLLGSLLFIGTNKLTQNYYIGRLITSLSLFDLKFESQYGTVTGHQYEIQEGWSTIKENWLLGVTPFGENLMQRFRTNQAWTFVHNAYLQVWIHYGLLGLILFIFLYIKSIQLGFFVFNRFKDIIGLILMTFLVCQMVKNIVWPTAISYINITVMYILLISLGIKTKRLRFRYYNNLNKEK